MNVALKRSLVRSGFRTAYQRSWSTEHAVSGIVRSFGTAIEPDLLLVFAGGKHPPDAVLRGLRMAYPQTPIVGGSAAGAISHSGFGYSGLEIGALAVFGRDSTPAVVTVDGLDRSEHEAGVELGRRIAALAEDGAPVFLFYDSVASAAPLRLHPAAALVSGVQAGLGNTRVRLVGGGLLTDLNLNDSWVFDGWSVRKHAAVALVFPAALTVETTVVHGCRPASAYMEITKVQGAEVFELDGRPALEVIERLLQFPIGGASGRELMLGATIGQKLGDPFAPFDENSYVNRLILSADRAKGSVTLFEPDLREGARVQIMARDNEVMLRSAREGAQAVSRALATAPDDAAFALYIDCAGRASAMSGAVEEEAEIVRKVLPRGVPMIGFYSGVEIAPFGDDARALDWTGVLASVCYRHDRDHDRDW